jgi:hypothetical protein
MCDGFRIKEIDIKDYIQTENVISPNLSPEDAYKVSSHSNIIYKWILIIYWEYYQHYLKKIMICLPNEVINLSLNRRYATNWIKKIVFLSYNW